MKKKNKIASRLPEMESGDAKILAVESAAAKTSARFKSMGPQMRYIRSLVGSEVGAVHKVLLSFLTLMTLNRPPLTPNEAILVAVAVEDEASWMLNDVGDIADFLDAAFGEEWFVWPAGVTAGDAKTLLAKLRMMSGLQAAALLDSARQWRRKGKGLSASFDELGGYFNLKTERGDPCRG
jgi:hypothetical protein